MPELLSYSTATPCLGLPMLFAGQAQKETTVNEALVTLDFLLPGAVEGVTSVPPTDPEVGMAWIVGPDAAGAFAGQVDRIGGWTQGGWRFVQPRQGMRLLDRTINAYRYYSDGWSLVAAPLLATGGSTVDIEARSCLAALLTALEEIGIISST